MSQKLTFEAVVGNKNTGRIGVERTEKVSRTVGK